MKEMHRHYGRWLSNYVVFQKVLQVEFNFVKPAQMQLPLEEACSCQLCIQSKVLHNQWQVHSFTSQATYNIFIDSNCCKKINVTSHWWFLLSCLSVLIPCWFTCKWISPQCPRPQWRAPGEGEVREQNAALFSWSWPQHPGSPAFSALCR